METKVYRRGRKLFVKQILTNDDLESSAMPVVGITVKTEMEFPDELYAMWARKTMKQLLSQISLPDMLNAQPISEELVKKMLEHNP